jgi:hypothetical protein
LCREKVLLVDDAFALFRPHVGASANQAAKHALRLAKVFRGGDGFEGMGRGRGEVYEANQCFQ